jgi:hypothetical protein
MVEVCCRLGEEEDEWSEPDKEESRRWARPFIHFNSVADPDPGSGAFLTAGSGIRNRFFPDLVSRIPTP